MSYEMHINERLYRFAMDVDDLLGENGKVTKINMTDKSLTILFNEGANIPSLIMQIKNLLGDITSFRTLDDKLVLVYLTTG